MKKNGFVFLETLVVVCVLSVSLMLLYKSYSHIVKKSREKNIYDTTAYIYKTYQLKDLVDDIISINNNPSNNPFYNTIVYNSSICNSTCSNQMYICNMKSSASLTRDTDKKLKNIANVFEIEKIYYFIPNDIYKTLFINNNYANCGKEIDATSIDYIRSLGKYQHQPHLVVKYKVSDKNNNSDGSYSIYFSSVKMG